MGMALLEMKPVVLPPTAPPEIWTKLKQTNREFVLRQLAKDIWDFTVDAARLSLAGLQNTATNDLIVQDALQQFNQTTLQIKDQILTALNYSTKEYGQRLLDDVNRNLDLLQKRLEGLANDNRDLHPALKETLATLSGSASAVTALLASLRIPTSKGEMGEVNVLNELKMSFLGITTVSIESMGGSGETDAIVRFDLNGVDLVKVLVEVKDRTAWSNSFLSQLSNDMKEQQANFGILVTSALPKSAKARGYSVADKDGIIIITTPQLAPATALLIYDLIIALDRFTEKGKTFNSLLNSRELFDCLNSNLSLVEPLRQVLKVIDKAHSEISSRVNDIIKAIQQNNSQLAQHLSPKENSAADAQSGLQVE